MFKIGFLLVFLTFLSIHAAVLDNRTGKKENEFSRNYPTNFTANPSARCYDSRLANFLNSGLLNYSHDMGALSKYILDQIIRARYSGYWFVHSEMIQNQRQGLEWQSVTNGDLFASSSTHGCYYHDTQTYVIILRY